MPAILDALKAQVEANVNAEKSAVLLINGIADRVQAAVDKALENGATEAELAEVQAQVDSLKASADALGAAVVSNTPSAPVVP